MIDDEAADRLRAVILGIPGAVGYVVVVDFGPHSSVLINNTDADQAAQHVHNAGEQFRRAAAEEQPLRVW